MAINRPSEAELKERADKQAQDALRKMPEPSEPQLSSSFDRQGEEERQIERAEEILNDRQSSDAFARRLSMLEEMFAKQNEMLMQFLNKAGFQALEQEPQSAKTIVTKPDIPLDAVVTIYIAEGMSPWEREPVMVGVNGNQRLIPRGCYTQVTKAELEVLQNAVYEGEEYPVVDDTPLARKNSAEHMVPSQAVPYRKARYAIMVHNLPLAA